METHVPIIERVPITPLPALSERERIRVAAITAIAEIQLGAEVEVTEEDRNLARQIMMDGRRVTKAELAKPAVILHLEALLESYDYDVVQDAKRLRAYVTNRLLEESNNPDPKIRLRALENLGKISDVGLFVERRELVVSQKSEQELEAELKESLARLLNPEDVIDVTPRDPGNAQDAQPPLYEPSISAIEDELEHLADD